MNIIFNEYILNSAKYLQKYKNAIPKAKKRRDKSGITKLRTDISGSNKEKEKKIETKEKSVDETTGAGSAGAYVAPMGYERKKEMDETTTASSSGAYETPFAWSKNGMPSKTKPQWKGGKILNMNESNYLVDPKDFKDYISFLNEGGIKIDKTNPNYNLIKFIQDNSEAYGSLQDMSDNDLKIIVNDIKKKNIEENIGDISKEEKIVYLLNHMGSINHIASPIDPEQWLERLSDGKIDILYKNALKKDKEKMANKLVENINKKDYVFYVVNPKTSKIETGWEYKEDAIERKNDMDIPMKVFSKKFLISKNINPDDDKNWGNPSQLDEKAKSKAQQRAAGMALSAKRGDMDVSDLKGAAKDMYDSMSEKELEKYAETKRKGLPNKVEEESVIDDNPSSMKMKPPIGINGNMESGLSATDLGEMVNKFKNIAEQFNKDMEEFNVNEDRKPSSLVMKDRLGKDNQKNFKKDLEHSGTKEIIDVTKQLQYKDEQTDVDDPQKLGQDIEKEVIKKTDGKSFKNVGNSTNKKGDEIPKRNLTKDEQEEVNLFRKGLGDYVYDNKPSQRFEDRMKKDMGDENYKMRQKKMEFNAKAPMYNKDTQPIENGIDKVQYDKAKSKWNNKYGINESMITGKYKDLLNKTKIVDFHLNEAIELDNKKDAEDLFKLSFDGLGNTYNNKVKVNEDTTDAISNFNFYTDGDKFYVMENKQSLNENEEKESKKINEGFDKMKHLFDYNGKNYINTKNNKL